MQETSATNSQNMNTTATVKKVWIVRGDCDCYEPCHDFPEAYEILKDWIIDNMPEWDKANNINYEYGSIQIGTYWYDAYEIADDKGIVDEVLGDMIDNAGVCDIDDYGEVARSEIWEEMDIIVGMAIEEPNGDIHYVKDIDDYNGMADPTELTSADGIEWTITPHDDGTLTASMKVEEPQKPETEYYLNIIEIKGGNVQIEEMKCLGEDGFNSAIVECVKNGLTMCADTYRTDEIVKAFLLNTKEN